MVLKIKISSATINKISRLAQITQELYQGKNFNITRLTTLKSLCKNADTAAHFVFHLAKCTAEEMEKKESKYIESEKWKQHKSLVNKAIIKISKYFRSKNEKEKKYLKHLLSQIKQLQNEHENQRWGPVRIIESSETLLIEKALECILSPDHSGFWGYQVGREYAERFDSSYGAGLIPGSAPLMENIVNFWKQYYGLEK